MSDTMTPPGVGGPGPPQPMPPLAGGPVPGGFPGMRPTPPLSQPGAGAQASGVIKLGEAIKAIQEAMMMLPIGSDIHKAAAKAIQDLSRHVPVGPNTQGVQQTQAQDNRRNIVQQALMGAIGGQAANRPMPPSVPLPGA
jgi:hypothetical protein